MSKLLKLKEWVTLEEGAKHLSVIFGEDVAVSDVLRLALDGKLTLSVHFVNHARGRCALPIPFNRAPIRVIKKGPLLSVENVRGTTLENVSMLPTLPTALRQGLEDGTHFITTHAIHLRDDEYLDLPKEMRTLDGVWDLLMLGAERLDVEHLYQQMTGGPEVTLMNLDGAFVRQPDGEICQLQERFDEQTLERMRLSRSHAAPKAKPPIGDADGEAVGAFNDPGNYFPAGRLPDDARLVVRTAALNNLVTQLVEAQKQNEKPSTGERDKLLRQIGALALVVASKGGKYQRGGKPNGTQIAQAALDVAAAIPGAQVNGKGLGGSEMRDSIAAGVRLLTDEELPRGN